MQKKPKIRQILTPNLNPEQRNTVFKLSDQLLTLMLDPTNSIDTEFMVYYLKSKIKKKE